MSEFVAPSRTKTRNMNMGVTSDKKQSQFKPRFSVVDIDESFFKTVVKANTDQVYPPIKQGNEMSTIL